MKILELTLPSTHLNEQDRLYRDVLGFDGVRISQQHLRVTAGDTILNFVSSPRQFRFHYCFLVPPGCLPSLISFLDQRTFQPLLFEGERIVDFGNGKSVYFDDADGNIAEFIQRPGLGHQPKKDFCIQDVIRLNEIGMPAYNPRQQAQRLIDQFAIDLVEGGLVRDDFVWCGDFEGVFLIPQVGRHWIPTDRAAEINELAVRFETRTGVFDYSIRVSSSE